MHALNGMKYSFAIAAASFRTAYSLNKTLYLWYILAWVFSVMAAASGTYWDLVIDWGLLQRHSKNRWLRDKLLIPWKSVYFVAMVRVRIEEYVVFYLAICKDRKHCRR